MLEHLLSPEFDDLDDLSVEGLLSAQASTAEDFLDQFNSPEHLVDSANLQKARDAFVATTNTTLSAEDAKQAILKLRVPEAVKHLAGMLSQYDWDYVEQAKEIRGYVVAKLLDESKHPDARIRLKAVGMLGNLTEVGAFTERIEVVKTDLTADALAERIRAKLAGLLPKRQEIQDAEIIDAPPDEEVGNIALLKRNN